VWGRQYLHELCAVVENLDWHGVQGDSKEKKEERKEGRKKEGDVRVPDGEGAIQGFRS